MGNGGVGHEEGVLGQEAGNGERLRHEEGGVSRREGLEHLEGLGRRG